LACKSVLGISYQNTLNEVFGFSRYTFPVILLKFIFARLDLLKECKVVLLVEWRSSTEKNESYDTNAP